MSAVFIKVFNMSVAAGWVIIAVAVLRLLLRKAPKWATCLLWAIAAVRLVLPISIKSALSLIPSAQTVSPDIVYSPAPVIDSGIGVVNRAINPVITETFAPNAAESVNPLQIFTEIAAYVWLIGAAVLLIYAAVSYLTLRRRVDASVKGENGVYLCDGIGTPFILGVFRPRIYIPSDMDDADVLRYVVAHENAHLRRRDHLWKPLGYALLAVYWFNPLCWLAYILLCRDIESACDESVIRRLGMDVAERKGYSDALLSCSSPRKMITACPLAFGEAGVKSRIKSVLSYKKPAFWIIIAAVVVCAVLAVCFLTNPKDGGLPDDHFYYEGLYLRCDNGADMLIADGYGPISMTPDDETVSFGGLTDGDKIKVEFYLIEEIYPARAVAYGVEKLADGEYSDIDDAMLESLTGLGWLTAPLLTEVGTGPFAGYIRDAETEMIEIYTAVDGELIGQIPYAVAEQFPASDRSAESYTFGWMNAEIYYGATGRFRWAVICTGPSMGSGSQNVCTSGDGGETWRVGDMSATYPGTVTGAGFASETVGFMSYRYWNDNGSEIARTVDGGITWERMTVEVPESLAGYRMTPLVPVFDGENGRYPVRLYDGVGEAGMAYLVTYDGGVSWEWSSDAPSGEVYTRFGLKIPLPLSYSGKVTVTVEDELDADLRDRTVIELYHSASLAKSTENHKLGWMYSIIRVTEEELVSPEDNPGGSLYFAKDGEWYYTLTRPTSMEFDLSVGDEYMTLSNEASVVMADFIAANGLEPYEHNPDKAEKTLTLGDVTALSAKGMALTWSDFDGYAYSEVGSGLYIRLYQIDENYFLLIGGGSTEAEPMYIHLRYGGADSEDYADIRTESAAEFIGKHEAAADFDPELFAALLPNESALVEFYAHIPLTENYLCFCSVHTLSPDGSGFTSDPPEAFAVYYTDDGGATVKTVDAALPDGLAYDSVVPVYAGAGSGSLEFRFILKLTDGGREFYVEFNNFGNVGGDFMRFDYAGEVDGTAVDAYLGVDNPASPTVALTEETAAAFIAETLGSLTLTADDAVTFRLPDAIPASDDGKTALTVTLNATYSPEPGTYDVQRLLDYEQKWSGGDVYRGVLEPSRGDLKTIMLRVAFMTEIEENAYREFAANYVELSAPFTYGEASAVSAPTAEVSAAFSITTVKYTLQDGASFNISLKLPDGVTLTEVNASRQYDAQPPAFDVMLGGEIIGGMTLNSFAAPAGDVLSLVTPSDNSLPMPVFAMLMTNHAGYEEYSVKTSSATGAGATAKYVWQDLNDYTGPAAGAPWFSADCVLAYDAAVTPYFMALLLTKGVFTAEQLETAAASVSFGR